MSKQLNFVLLLQLLILPSLCLAECSEPEISSFNVTYGVAEWEGNYNSSCLKGFEVCWEAESSFTKYCEMVAANQTKVTLLRVRSCAFLNATLTAIGEGVTNVSASAHGHADLPRISSLKAVTTNRNLVQLSWSSLATYPCVSNLNLWICNETQARNTCMHQELQPSITNIEFFSYEFPACQYFNAYMYSTDYSKESILSETDFFIGSNNKLTNARVTNVTSSSAVIQYQLSIVDQNCSTDRLQVCYDNTNCRTVPLNEFGSTRYYTLTYLDACTTYDAELTLLRTESYNAPQQVIFTTPRDGKRLLKYVTATTNYGRILVEWGTSLVNTPCILVFQVTWNATTNLTSSAYVMVDARSYTIYTSSVDALEFNIEVTAVFVDGGQESMFTQVSYPGMPSSSNRLTITASLLVSSLIALRYMFGTN